MSTERRQHDRTQAFWDVYCNHHYLGILIDLSLTGAKIWAEHYVTKKIPEEQFILSIRSPYQFSCKEVNLIGQIRWSHPPENGMFYLGVEFINLQKKQKDDLNTLIDFFRNS